MKLSYITLCIACLLLALPGCDKSKAPSGETDPIFNEGNFKPVNPDASPEARKLLRYLYHINGKKTLTGMHNVLGKMSVNSDSIYALTGKYPAIWGGDFGFADSTHDIDNIKYRSLLVDEIKKQYSKGSIIVMSYHQANPAIGEPCQFEGGIISKLTDAQWKELLTPGTPLYEAWRKQMDLFATYLVQLRDAKIPVIFRPYHEMNGNWFWWGGRKGNDGYVALWKQLFNYYTKERKLDNIIWAWTTDRPWDGVEDFFPGHEYVDVIGSDIYPLKDTNVVYRQEWFEKMNKLAAGKPLALSENGVITPVEILAKQPWVWFMSWGGMVFKSSPEEIKSVYNAPEVVSLDSLPDWKNAP